MTNALNYLVHDNNRDQAGVMTPADWSAVQSQGHVKDTWRNNEGPSPSTNPHYTGPSHGVTQNALFRRQGAWRTRQV